MIGWACCYNQLLLWFIYIGVCIPGIFYLLVWVRSLPLVSAGEGNNS